MLTLTCTLARATGVLDDDVLPLKIYKKVYHMFCGLNSIEPKDLEPGSRRQVEGISYDIAISTLGYTTRLTRWMAPHRTSERHDANPSSHLLRPTLGRR